MKKLSLQVDALGEGERLDRFLARAGGVSRGEARRVIGRGGVWVGGRRVKAESRSLRQGQKVEMYLLDERELASLGALPLVLPAEALLFRDRHLAAVCKPPFVPAQSTPTCDRGDLLSLTQALLRQPLHLVHRLDKETSGVTLFALNKKSAAALSQGLQTKETRKRYLALLAPSASLRLVPRGASPLRELPGEGRVDLPIGIGADRPGQRCIDDRGQPAATRFRILTRFDCGAVLAEAFPETGRMHQIRVHFAALGWALLGDRTYGGRMTLGSLAGEVSLPRVMLHAAEISFRHPSDGRWLTVQAPLPEDFAGLTASFAASQAPEK